MIWSYLILPTRNTFTFISDFVLLRYCKSSEIRIYIYFFLVRIFTYNVFSTFRYTAVVSSPVDIRILQRSAHNCRIISNGVEIIRIIIPFYEGVGICMRDTWRIAGMIDIQMLQPNAINSIHISIIAHIYRKNARHVGFRFQNDIMQHKILFPKFNPYQCHLKGLSILYSKKLCFLIFNWSFDEFGYDELKT